MDRIRQIFSAFLSVLLFKHRLVTAARRKEIYIVNYLSIFKSCKAVSREKNQQIEKNAQAGWGARAYRTIHIPHFPDDAGTATSSAIRPRHTASLGSRWRQGDCSRCGFVAARHHTDQNEDAK